MQTEHKHDPFTQYSLKKYHALLHSLPQIDPKQKAKALAQGCILRHRYKLYKGDKNYIEDLQVVLDDDRDLAPHVLKELNVMVNKDGSTVLSQCTDCGRYMPPFKYCARCNNAHFCSEACDVRSKLSHQAVCKPRQLPSVDAALQIQLHVGGDLGKEVEVYYQHQMRMSLKIRGEAFIRSLFDYFIGDGKNFLPTDCRPEIINGHLSMRRADSVHVASSGKPFVAENMDALCQVYSSNKVLGQVALQCLRSGGILAHLVKEVHNNHLHLIYIFLCC